jgi:hypothetical protein
VVFGAGLAGAGLVGAGVVGAGLVAVGTGGGGCWRVPLCGCLFGVWRGPAGRDVREIEMCK